MNSTSRRVAIVRDASDDVAMSGQVSWAVGELTEALTAAGIVVEQQEPASNDGDGSDLVIVASGPGGGLLRQLATNSEVALPTVPEAVALAAGQLNGRPAVLAAGSDARGLVYALLELTDRVATAAADADPIGLLMATQPSVEQPANPIRGVARLQVSDVEDLPWFYDRAGWERYLTMLMTHRFNRVHLAFGIGHDFLRNVLDAYLLFPYPFLVDLPGHDVYAVHTPTGTPLPADERERNLDTLRFISDEAAKRGLHFQLGIWTQQYQWTDSPNATYITEGLSSENHATYCRDALRAIVEACPGIAGVTLRVHGESGVPEGNYDFWRTVYTGLTSASRRVELDLHPKGVDRAMIELALETGLPINVSPKYTAEHMGLPGHQAAIRPTEAGPHRIDGDSFMQGLMNRSHFDLSYTRYGYADFLEEGRDWGVYYRIWPGTQRLLLWGNPHFAAGYGRFGSIGGSLGVEVMEPLSFKGRRGSGLPGGRHAYADATLAPAGGAWEKYRYTFRLFGRLLYNPDADPDSWQRQLRHEFGNDAAGPVATALAEAGRILPLVTTAHHPSAANNRYWPEIYTNMPIVEGGRFHPYRDTVEPRRFGTVSPHDPMTFSSIEAFADGVVSGTRDARYSPLRVAEWLTAAADAASTALTEAEQAVSDASTPEFRRLAIDVRMQVELGRFYASKLRAGVAYALFQRTGQRGYLEQAVSWYEQARGAWVDVVEHGSVYRDDVTVGGEAWLRGHWSDRLPAIDDDLGDMRAELAGTETGTPAEGAPNILGLDPEPPAARHTHVPPADYQRGAPVSVTLEVQTPDGTTASVTLLFRHLTQAERYESLEMVAQGGTLEATIPAAFTDSPYGLIYLFEVRSADGSAWRYPGLHDDLANEPYFIVRPRASLAT